ncbi:MAG: F0F1 ATP synthase subunit B [Endomicrobia bacterium]|nr:F0F1 ATP synthase subunit B [Endomicrobiia bacterium]MCL2506547.1 F0F1 ATP synthase subunit B [Endomicrobiia bacterium]
MEEILNIFGLETSLFLFQVINFLIVAFILKKFLYNPLMKKLDERKNKIEKGLKDAEDAGIALENAAQERQKILAGAKADADAFAVSAKAALDETKEKFTADAKNRSQQIIEEAKQKASAEFENMNKQIGAMSVEIAGKVISKTLEGLFTEDEKQKVTARALEKIKKGDYEKSAN